MVRSKQLAIDIYNELAQQRGYKLIEQEKVSGLSKLSIPNRIKALNIPAVHLPKLVIDIKSVYKGRVHTLSAVDGIEAVFAQLSQRGIKPDILSSNTVENIKLFAKMNNFSDHFGTVYSGTNIFGKNRVINKYVKDNYISKSELIYVGDELRDIEACKKAGVKIIAVTWGYDSGELLKSAQPDFLIDHPEDILKIINVD
jgi:phosphoglycolate phosphatase